MVLAVSKLLQVIADVIMEELHADFENLVIIEPHDHEHIVKTCPTDLDHLRIALDSGFYPAVLLLEEFAVKHGDVFTKDLENLPFPFDGEPDLLDFLFFVGDGEDFVELDGCIFEHEQKFQDLVLVVGVEFQTSNFD